STGLVEVLDRVLDKGLVVAGDIKVSLAEVELLTIRIRLLKSEEHTSELQSQSNLVCRLLLEKKKMNVDGGAVVQTFLYPPDIGLRVNLRSGQHARERHAYIIRNGRLDPDWSSVDRRFATIAGRAISTMTFYSGYNDILRIYATTRRDGVDYNLAYIEADFPQTKHEQFDPTYLRALFAYGYDKGKRGPVWHKTPPLLEPAPA